jgi:hypothetical protein
MMPTPRTHVLTWRQALARVIASVALGTAVAAAIAVHGSSASAAKVDPAPTGTAAAQLSVLQRGPITQSPPSSVSAGLASGSADTAAVHLLGANVDGLGISVYAAARANGGACSALDSAKGGVGTTCVDDLLPSGISLNAADAAGWLLYGFAADGVVAVDVLVAGKALPATMLPNAYVASLGASDLSGATLLVVHHADGTADTVANDLRAPGS